MPEPFQRKWCACGWPRPLFAVTRKDGSLPGEDLLIIYACPACSLPYVAGEVDAGASLEQLALAIATHLPRPPGPAS